MQKGQRVEGLLIENGKVQGVRAKLPFSFLSPATKTGEWERAASAAWTGGPGGLRRPGEGGKGAGRRRGPIPLPNFGGGDPQGGVRRPWPWRAGGGHGQREQGRPRASARGEKGEGGPGHLPRPLARAGRQWGRPAMGSRRGGGAGLRRWRCCAEEEGARRWRWLWSWGAARGLFIGRVRWWVERWGGGRGGGRPASFAGRL